MTWSRATAIAGSAVVTLACCRIRIVRGHREPEPEARGGVSRKAEYIELEVYAVGWPRHSSTRSHEGFEGHRRHQQG
jgi:hypothetical protein